MTLARTKAQSALGLRLAGVSFEEIAEALKMRSPEVAQAAVERALAAEVTPEERDKHRQLASLRYERLLRALWGKAVDPKSSEQLPAARACREIIDRMVALHGAAAPQEIIVSNPTNDAIVQWVLRVAPIELPGVEEADPFADAQDAEIVPESGV